MLWKELHTARPRGLAQVVGAVIALGLVALIGYGTYRFARPAFLEWFAHGLGPATSDVQRTAFNQFLRHITSWVEFFTLLIAAGVAAEGVTAERARETWDGLIATPLDGRAILGAKMIGAAWKVRWGLILLVVLWSVGLLTGALHPLGFAAALVLLGVATWFMAALGTFVSLVSRDTAQASNRTLIPVLLLSGSFLVVYLPTRIATILMGSASVPFVNWLSLVSYGDIAAIVSGQETFERARGDRDLHGRRSAPGAGHLPARDRRDRGRRGRAHPGRLARFDRAVGRPERAPEEQGERDAPARLESNLRLQEADTGAGPYRLRPFTLADPVGELIVAEPVVAGRVLPRPRSRVRSGLLLGLLTVFVTFGVVYFIVARLSQRSLRDALAETDRLSPGWRFDDLEAARADVPGGAERRSPRAGRRTLAHAALAGRMGNAFDSRTHTRRCARGGDACGVPHAWEHPLVARRGTSWGPPSPRRRHWRTCPMAAFRSSGPRTVSPS